MIETPRLHLVPFEVDHAAALQSGSSKLGPLLGVTVPEGWPHTRARQVHVYVVPGTDDGSMAGGRRWHSKKDVERALRFAEENGWGGSSLCRRT